MPLLVALWLAVLQALATVPPALPLAGGSGWPVAVAGIGVGPAIPAAGSAPARRVVGSTRPAADARAHAGAPRPADEAVHAAQPVRGIAVARGATWAAHGAPPAALGAAPRLSTAAVFAAAVRARALEASHAVAARGAVLPYFPTAPPLRG